MTGKHRLTPLLAPESIAYVGASPRPGSSGNTILRLSRRGGFSGRVYPVNPNHDEIDGERCYASLSALPEPPDLVVIALADHRLETALGEAIDAGAAGAVIFGGANFEADRVPVLAERLATIAREANLPICGGNCMGFYNLDRGVRITFAWPPYDTRRGGIALISHSGSSWSSLAINDERLGFNLAISAGQELTVTVAEYLDYVLDQESTRAVGLILETIREPDHLRAALEKANHAEVPVIALKVGRTAESARLALSHSGAIAGDDAAYEALFDRYGVGRATTIDELAAALYLLSMCRSVGPGALAAIHDSGFERELLVDLAAEHRVELAELSPETSARLEQLLDPGLEPTNPLDAWGTGHDFERIFTEGLSALMQDPATALGFVSHSPRTGAHISEAWVQVCIEAAGRTEKPVAMVTNFPWTRHRELVDRLTEARIPIIEGMDKGLLAARHAFAHRDFRDRPALSRPPGIAPAVCARWRARLRGAGTLDEADSLALLEDYGIPAVPRQVVRSREEVHEAARRLSGLTALKTAAPGIRHKTDVDGVRLNVQPEDLGDAYDEIARRLGPRALIAPMVPAGVEMSLGIISDVQFGPLVMIGAGGVFIEVMRDRRLALPPFDSQYAKRLIDQLRSKTLLDGHRGSSGANVDAFAEAAARLSVLADDLGDLIAELDINPIIVGVEEAVAVDAMVVTRDS